MLPIKKVGPRILTNDDKTLADLRFARSIETQFGELVVRAVNNHARLLEACKQVESRFNGTIIGAEPWFLLVETAIGEAEK